MQEALELLRDDLSLTPAGVAEWNPAEKQRWSLDERTEYARAAIHEIHHLAAHPGGVREPGRADADLSLGFVGSLLRYYLER